MKRKTFVRAFAAGLSILLLLTGCGSKETPSETLSEEEIWGTMPEETKGIEVQTDYFTFEYPKEWENKVTEVHTQEGNNCVVSFKTDISGQDVLLFSVILGSDPSDGFLLGKLEDGDDVVYVYTAVNDMPAEDWSEEEYNEICSLQERINEIIMQFHEDERFVPSR